MNIMNTSNGSKATQTNMTNGRVKRPNVAKTNADTFALKLFPVIQELAMTGTASHSVIATALNERGIPTARGGKWSITTVTNLIGRLAVIDVKAILAAKKDKV